MVKEDKLTSDATNDQELKGTFISVLIIGVLILLFWGVTFYVYITR